MNRESNWRHFFTLLQSSRSFQILRAKTGAALMLALFATTLLMVIATEIMYETSVEYVVTTQSVNRVRAYWAARAGVEMSLMRIHIFKQAQSMAGAMLPDPTILDEIWRQPFLWPPPIPKEASAVDKDQIQKAVKNSDMSAIKASYFATIESEGAKIDINDLGSPSKIMAQAANNQILQIFTSRMENDEEFGRRHRGVNFQELINNIADWIDADKEGRNGGDEGSLYSRDADAGELPPNQPLKSLEELHQVSGMTDEFYSILAPSLTLYGAKGINVNQAPKEVFFAFGTAFTPERVERILNDRKDPKRGPFKDEAEFVGYLNSIGINGNPFETADGGKIPLVFEPETNFRIQSTGKSGQAQSDIVAVVFDQDKIRTRLEAALLEQAKTKTPNAAAPTPTPTPPPADAKKDQKPAATPAPLKRPKIVYWNEQ